MIARVEGSTVAAHGDDDVLAVIDYVQLSPAAQRAALERPQTESVNDIDQRVRATIQDVRARGDAALLYYAEQFDGGAPKSLRIDSQEVDRALNSLSRDSIAALQRAIDNVRRFHEAQQLQPIRLETEPGVVCERILRPIERVGLYVPAGSAPLPSALIMSAIPAAIAGCPLRVLCTPARGGAVSAIILAAAKLCGITEIFAIGGAQAIAGMAYGTETIPKVDKIFGPGSAWVTAAKQQVAQDPQGAAIDLPAGPSEVMVIADESARAEFVAADLLAQAEHDPLSQAILLTPSATLASAVREAALRHYQTLSRQAVLSESLKRSRILLVKDIAHAIDIANRYAPEHLLLQVRQARDWLDRIISAGSIFLGDWSPEPMGDYCSGTNHVLPTYGYARAYSGLSLIDFSKRITIQELSPAGLRQLGPTARALAELEGLDAHALAVNVRLSALELPASERGRP
jgi:histidinol dehydrogenase